MRTSGNTTNRQRRAQLRNLTRELRAQRRATKAVATGTPQPARIHLIAAGLDTTTAHRFAAAFSRTCTATTTGTATIKLTSRSRRTKRVAVKLYDAATFLARLLTYRPKDPAAAARFERIALGA